MMHTKQKYQRLEQGLSVVLKLGSADQFVMILLGPGLRFICKRRAISVKQTVSEGYWQNYKLQHVWKSTVPCKQLVCNKCQYSFSVSIALRKLLLCCLKGSIINRIFRPVLSILRLLEAEGGIKSLPLTKIEYKGPFRTIPPIFFIWNKQTNFLCSLFSTGS